MFLTNINSSRRFERTQVPIKQSDNPFLSANKLFDLFPQPMGHVSNLERKTRGEGHKSLSLELRSYSLTDSDVCQRMRSGTYRTCAKPPLAINSMGHF